MKKYIILIICALVLFPYCVFAQEVIEIEEDVVLIEKDEDTQSTIIYNGTSYNFIFDWKKKKCNPRESHWPGIGFAFSDLDNLGDNMLRRSKSYSITLNLMDFIVPFHPHWLLASGLGMDWTRYHFKGHIGLEEVDGYTQFVPAQEDVEYKSSKLLVYYVTIPLLIEYQTTLRRNSTFFINGGVEGLIKYYSKSQIDVRNGKNVEKVNLGRDLNLLPVNVRLRAQIGIDDISVFGYYQPISLFKDGEGPELYPYALGVSLNF